MASTGAERCDAGSKLHEGGEEESRDIVHNIEVKIFCWNKAKMKESQKEADNFGYQDSPLMQMHTSDSESSPGLETRLNLISPNEG
jgi:hypothetical protein